MTIGVLELQVRIDSSFSLKDKRRVLQGLTTKGQRFGVSIAEVDDCDLWNVATMGVCVVSNQQAHCESVLGKVVALFDSHPEIEIESERRWFEFD